MKWCGHRCLTPVVGLLCTHTPSLTTGVSGGQVRAGSGGFGRAGTWSGSGRFRRNLPEPAQTCPESLPKVSLKSVEVAYPVGETETFESFVGDGVEKHLWVTCGGRSSPELIASGCPELEPTAPLLAFDLTVRHGPFDDM
jgi:hypothetical protein